MKGDVFESTPQKSTADERWSAAEARRSAGGAGRVAKVVVLGNTAVGKTSIIRRFAKDEFIEKYRATIGADFLSKTVNSGNQSLVLQIWDTAGQERFKALSSVFFRGADASILVCAVDDRDSLFVGVPDWHKELISKSSADSSGLLLAVTKIDIPDWQLSKTEVEAVAISIGIRSDHVIYVSSLTGEGVEKLFSFVASEVVSFGDATTIDITTPLPATITTPLVVSDHPKTRECVCRSC